MGIILRLLQPLSSSRQLKWQLVAWYFPIWKYHATTSNLICPSVPSHIETNFVPMISTNKLPTIYCNSRVVLRSRWATAYTSLITYLPIFLSVLSWAMLLLSLPADRGTTFPSPTCKGHYISLIPFFPQGGYYYFKQKGLTFFVQPTTWTVQSSCCHCIHLCDSV